MDRLNFTPAGRRYQDVTNRCFAKNDDALMIVQWFYDDAVMI